MMWAVVMTWRFCWSVCNLGIWWINCITKKTGRKNSHLANSNALP
ncbi:hypothetical protein [Moraxella lacunata]